MQLDTAIAMFKQLFKKEDGENKKEVDPLEKVMPIEDVHSVSAADSGQKDVDWGDWSVDESTNNGSSAFNDDQSGPITPGTGRSFDTEETPKSASSRSRGRSRRSAKSSRSLAAKLERGKKEKSAGDALSAVSKALDDSSDLSDDNVSKSTIGSKMSSSGAKKKKKKKSSKSSSSVISEITEDGSKRKRSRSRRRIKNSTEKKDAEGEKLDGGSSHKRSSSRRRKPKEISCEEPVRLDNGSPDKPRRKVVRRYSSDDELIQVAGSLRQKLTKKSMSSRQIFGSKKVADPKDDLRASSTHTPRRHKSSGDEIAELAQFANVGPNKKERPVRRNTSHSSSDGSATKPSRHKSSPNILGSKNSGRRISRKHVNSDDAGSSANKRRSAKSDLGKVLEVSERSAMSAESPLVEGSSHSLNSSSSKRSLQGGSKGLSRISKESPGARLSARTKKKRSASKKMTAVDLNGVSPPLDKHDSEHDNSSVKSKAKKEKGSNRKPHHKSDPDEEDLQRAEILRLQKQLSEALQKVVVITEEQIREKDEFLKVSTELSQLKGDFADVQREKEDLKQQVEQGDAAAQTTRERILKLEDAIERSLDEQERLMKQLEQSEDDYEKLLIETQDLEAKLKDTDGYTDTEAIRNELKEAKKSLVDKEREVESQKHTIEHLEKEVKDNATVNKLQVDELEAEKKALDGKIKGERLEMQSKMTRKDETIGMLQKELSKYKNDSGMQDVAVVSAALQSAQSELDMARNDAERAERQVDKLKDEKEDLLGRNNALNDQVKVLHKNVNELTAKTKDLGEKVLQWTEKTYDWKTRAEKAEKLLDSGDAQSVESSDDLAVDESPQGLFLQSVMDKQTKDKGKRGWGNMFARDANGGEDLSGEAIRIKTLEERNTALEETIASLKSEMVKMQTAHKGELYSSQKMVAQLQGENDALVLKNMTLEQITTLNEVKGQGE